MIAFFFTIPISMIRPTIEYRFSSLWNKASVASVPTPADGSPDRIVTGWTKLSYSIPITR